MGHPCNLLYLYPDNTSGFWLSHSGYREHPAARHDKSSPIYGMPIIDADRAKTVFVVKRSMNTGFAGIENELFYGDNTLMLFGDAKAMLANLLAALKE